MKGKITFTDIRAIKLAPGDLLVVQCAKLSDEQERELAQELTKALWGRNNQFKILKGNFQLATVTPPPTPQ